MVTVCGLEIGDEYQLAYGAPSLNETKYPWVTALYQKIRGKFINVCGGSIISRKLVLTGKRKIFLITISAETRYYGDFLSG